MCWIGACLADALNYAHERGLLHLDLKPSNVLLAADGQPLLLDFHLAHVPIQPDGPAPTWIGGTLAYMSPEQRAALAALRAGSGPSVAVDGRSDIYALGLLLYEALGGTVPFPPGGPIRLSRIRPDVSSGLEAILHKCLAPDPRDRYPDAAALAADLRRHLADLPLRGVANRSPMERWRKLRRRQPQAPALIGMFLAVVAAALIVGASTIAHIARRHEAAAGDLAEGRVQLRDSHYAEAVRSLERGMTTARGLPGARALTDNLDRALRIARRAAMADQLHAVADRVRFLFGAEVIPTRSTRGVAAQCLALWEARDRLIIPREAELDPDLERRIRSDLSDLVVLWGDLAVRQAPEGERSRAHREALRVLDEAESILPPSPLLCRERQAHAQALGLASIARAAARRAAAIIPQTTWDHEALGLALLRCGEFGPASAEFRLVLESRPQDFWPNFYEGICAFRQHRYDDAEDAFQVCVALSPQSADCFYNRAAARERWGRPSGPCTITSGPCNSIPVCPEPR